MLAAKYSTTNTTMRKKWFVYFPYFEASLPLYTKNTIFPSGSGNLNPDIKFPFLPSTPYKHAFWLLACGLKFYGGKFVSSALYLSTLYPKCTSYGHANLAPNPSRPYVSSFPRTWLFHSQFLLSSDNLEIQTYLLGGRVLSPYWL